MYKFIKDIKNIKLFYTYLAGAIEADKDTGGAKWRDAITLALENVSIYIQDPVKTEPLATQMSTIEAQEKFNSWITSGHYDKFNEKFEKIVQKDIRMVHRSDFLIVHLFPEIPTVGTIHEMSEAWRLKKPIYIIWTDAKSKLSKWALYLCIDSGGQVFENKKQLTDYLAIRYNKKIQSFRVIIIQFCKSICRLIEERIYYFKLKKIKASLAEITTKIENKIEEIKKKS